ncbi:peptidoglycan-binding protein [Lachnoclostridium phytofermentans]|uniref:Peptidoglycan-binding domain 1 protein n=1 Tax=Lachnoclostridium phytofermentans (strain ATCC 700394 / DSM 18823 / ISDg) TaxID=357809 RepID=A9KPR1_LACP7|nr:peptidoglycan-binding protein [Lachnoclostridium phytofermentans]ABX41810.1 Peptidoglycan-binding domain 1 protein [Lachnoclostridium phytofermentans ISDg]
MANGDNASVTLAKIRAGTAYFQQDSTTYSDELKAVQKALYLYGYCPGGAPDGYFGSGMLGAVKGFQNENGLLNDGLFGQSSLTKLEAWSGTIYGTPTATPSLDQVRNGLDYYHSGDTGTPVTTIRTLLNNKGYTCASTGSYDADLVNVVKSFQTAMGLSSDGSAGQGTLAALEDTISDTAWLSSGTVNLTAGKLARVGFKNILLRRDIVTLLNNALNTHSINTKEKVKQFLAQCKAETDSGASLVEYIYRPGTTGTASYAPYYGAGFLQLTWSDAYTQYKAYKGDSKILSPGEYATQHVAIAYPGDSAGWFWNTYKSFNNNSVVDWSGTAQSICTTLTTKITGSSSGATTRYNNYQQISNVLK